jgi:hypothetical protein
LTAPYVTASATRRRCISSRAAKPCCCSFIVHGQIVPWLGERPLGEEDCAVGFDTFILWSEGEDQLARFAAQVVPAARTQVEAERS